MADTEPPRKARRIDMIINVDKKCQPPLQTVWVYNESWMSDVLFYTPLSGEGEWPQFPNIAGVKKAIKKEWGFVKDVPMAKLHISYAERVDKNKVVGVGESLNDEWAVN